MSVPLLLITGTLLTAVGLIFLLDHPRWVKWTGTGAAVIFALLPFFLPVGEPIRLLNQEWIISSTLFVLGRKLVVTAGDLPLLSLLFGSYALWFFALDIRNVSLRLVPLGMMGLSLVIAAYAVQPIFYAAIFFAFLALLDAILLTPPSHPATQGVLRFLIFQIMGTLLILFAIWMLSWVEIGAAERILLLRALVIMGLGFSLLLAIFPFTSWLPLLAMENQPFLAGFVFNTYLNGVLLFGFKFVSTSGWLPALIDLAETLQFVALMMVFLGGVTAFFSHHLGRTMGGAVMVEIGRSLLALSFLQSGYPLYFSLFIVQTLALVLWALSMTLIAGVVKDFRYSSLPGVAGQWPLVFYGIMTGQLTLAGLPLLAGFPVYWALADSLTGDATWRWVFFLTGNLGLLLGAVRSGMHLASSAGEENVLKVGNRLVDVTIGLLIIGLILLGLSPRVLDPLLGPLAQVLLLK